MRFGHRSGLRQKSQWLGLLAKSTTLFIAYNYCAKTLEKNREDQ